MSSSDTSSTLTQDLIRQGVAQESIAASKQDQKRIKAVRDSLSNMGLQVWPDEDILRCLHQAGPNTPLDVIVERIISAPTNETPQQWQEVSKKKATTTNNKPQGGNRSHAGGPRNTAGHKDQGNGHHAEEQHQDGATEGKRFQQRREPRREQAPRESHPRQQKHEHQKSEHQKSEHRQGGRQQQQQQQQQTEKVEKQQQQAPVAPIVPVKTWANIVSGDKEKDAATVVVKAANAKPEKKQQATQQQQTQQQQQETTQQANGHAEAQQTEVSAAAAVAVESPNEAPKRNNRRGPRRDPAIVAQMEAANIAAAAAEEETAPAAVSQPAAVVEQPTPEPIVVEVPVIETPVQQYEKGVILPAGFTPTTTSPAPTQGRRGFVSSHNVKVASPVPSPAPVVQQQQQPQPQQPQQQPQPQPVPVAAAPVLQQQPQQPQQPQQQPANLIATTTPPANPGTVPANIASNHFGNHAGTHGNMVPPHMPPMNFNMPFFEPSYYDYMNQQYHMMMGGYPPYMGGNPIGGRGPMDSGNKSATNSNPNAAQGMNPQLHGSNQPHHMPFTGYMPGPYTGYGFSGMSQQPAPAPTASYNVRMNHPRAGYGFDEEYAGQQRSHDNYGAPSGYGSYNPHQQQLHPPKETGMSQDGKHGPYGDSGYQQFSSGGYHN